MSDKKRRLDSVAAAVQLRHGPKALRRGADAVSPPTVPHIVPHIATGFHALDALTGCGGVPLGAMTLISGRSTSGKLTVAYKVLAHAQRDGRGRTAYTVALLDLSRTADPDYLARCGLELNALLIGRPQPGTEMVRLLGDLLASRQVRAVVLDGLADLTAQRGAVAALNAASGKLQSLLRASSAALVVLDEPQPPWLRWLGLDAAGQVRGSAALHIEMRREQWLRQEGVLTGYRARAQLLKSRWAHGTASAPVELVFNGTVRAQETW